MPKVPINVGLNPPNCTDLRTAIAMKRDIHEDHPPHLFYSSCPLGKGQWKITGGQASWTIFHQPLTFLGCFQSGCWWDKATCAQVIKVKGKGLTALNCLPWLGKTINTTCNCKKPFQKKSVLSLVACHL